MANKYWVGGTGNVDGSDTTHWSDADGGAGGATYPGTSDALVFNANSGGGTATFTADHTVQSITSGASTTSIDVNDRNLTLTASAGWSNTGTGVRGIDLGNGTITLSSTAAGWDWTTVTNMASFSAGSGTIAFTGSASTSSRTFIGNSTKAYNIVSFAANTSHGLNSIPVSTTIATLQMTAPAQLALGAGITLTLTNGPVLVGTASNMIGIRNSSATNPATISTAGAMTITYGVLVGAITLAGGGTIVATNSYALGPLVGSITVTPPAGGGAAIIGG
jgi:hypothetical protein